MKSASIAILFLIAFGALAACSREKEKAAPAIQAEPALPKAAAVDARDAFESRSWVGGLPEALEGGSARLVMEGRVLAGPARIESGGKAMLVALAMEIGAGSELIIANDEGERLRAEALASPALSLVSADGAVVVSCADGSLTCFALGAGEAGISIVKRWATSDHPVARLLPLPGPGAVEGPARLAVAFDDGTLECLSLEDGSRIWGLRPEDSIADLAYARGLLLACAGSSITAYAEEDGSLVWRHAAKARLFVLAAGDGLVAAIGADSGLLALSAADGRLLSEAEGRYDPALRPAIDAGSIFAALRGGGAARIDAKTGTREATWEWPAPSSLLALDESMLYASSGSRLVARKRFAEGEGEDLDLSSAPAGTIAGLAAGNGRALIACADGLVALGAGESRLGDVFAPGPEAAEAISAALGELGGEWLAGKAAIYGEFVSGLPIYPPDGFVVLGYEQGAGGRRTLSASPDPGDSIIVAFDDRGVKLGSNVGELGSPGALTLWFEGGRRYWIAAGGRGARIEGGFALTMR